MAQESQQRLDAQFTFDDGEGVQIGLRLLTKVLEARLAYLEAQRADYDGAIEVLTGVALSRINEVLLPSLVELDRLISLGFPSTRITDSKPLGRSLIGTETQADARTLIGAASPAQVAAAVSPLQASYDTVLGRLNTLLAGADPLLDTFLELADRLKNDEAGLTAVTTAIGKRLRFDAAQTLSGPEIAQALGNLGIQTFIQQMFTKADQAAVRTHINAAQNYGFKPVKSLAPANEIYLGWDGSSITAGIDAVDRGKVWTNSNNDFNAGGYQKLASGLIIQFGYVASSDVFQAFPIVFPTALLSMTAVAATDPDGVETTVITCGQRSLNGFSWRPRKVRNGTVYQEPTAGTWIALGC